MFARLMPKEGRFFEQFTAHADIAMQCSSLLVDLLDSMTERKKFVDQIEVLEKKADVITHDTIDLLHQTFITPLDRDQIHKLISTMDDILDLMEDVGQTIYLYDIKTVTSEAQQLAEISVKCCERLRKALGMLHDLRNSDEILKICDEIDVLETDADRVVRAAIARLFRDEEDTRQLIKLKAIYDLLEEVSDKCEDVANIIAGIVLENA